MRIIDVPSPVESSLIADSQRVLGLAMPNILDVDFIAGFDKERNNYKPAVSPEEFSNSSLRIINSWGEFYKSLTLWNTESLAEVEANPSSQENFGIHSESATVVWSPGGFQASENRSIELFATAKVTLTTPREDATQALTSMRSDLATVGDASVIDTPIASLELQLGKDSVRRTPEGDKRLSTIAGPRILFLWRNGQEEPISRVSFQGRRLEPIGVPLELPYMVRSAQNIRDIAVTASPVPQA